MGLVDGALAKLMRPWLCSQAKTNFCSWLVTASMTS